MSGPKQHVEKARQVFSIPDDVEVGSDSTGNFTHWPNAALVSRSWWLLRTDDNRWRLDYGGDTIAISEDMEDLRLPYIVAKLERGL